MTVSPSLRVAASLLWLAGLGFGLPCIAAIRELRAGRDIPFILGFPAHGHGPLERHGYLTTVPLLIGFLAICLGEVAAGFLLWNGYRPGAFLVLILVPVGAFYWWGFALPIPPVLAVVR